MKPQRTTPERTPATYPTSESTRDPRLEDDLGAFGFHDDDAWRRRAQGADAAPPLGQIGGYTILAPCARGGQGVVYRCVSADARVVALKRIHGGPASRARLERELEILDRLDHPAIVRARPVVADDEILLEMEWIDGEPLTSWAWAGGRRRPTADILTHFRAVCDAVLHAHDRGVVHRDLKPSNLLVDRRDRPRILDFGIAKTFSEPSRDSARVTLGTQLLGTPAYAAPELIAGDPATVDARADVYSLGVLLYEAFTASSPYDPDLSLAQLLRAVEEVEPIRPRRVDPTVPRDVEAVILKALRKNRDERYASVRDLDADIACCLRGERPSAARAGLAFDVRCLAQRQPRLVAGLAVAFVAVLAIATISVVDAVRLRSSRNETLAAHNAAEKTNDVLLNMILELDSQPKERRDLLAARLAEMEKFLPREVGGDAGALARTKVAFGRLYAKLGRFEEADGHLSDALETYRAMGVADRQSVADALSLLGLARAHRKLSGAAEIQKEAVRMAERLFAPNAPTRATYYAAMGETLLLADGAAARAEADEWFERAIAQLGDMGRKYPGWPGEILADKARALATIGDAAAALDACRQAEDLFDADHEDPAQSPRYHELLDLDATLRDATGDATGAARLRARLASPSEPRHE
ncbi:MAG: serine/threonine protein kinase [Planctomycetes bacterium]|nr:serine/threonine protein kinase [Planctomycetota bacterium]MBI3845142.1 serine/threonine protein kinase [Planctomycetota bacterium]